MKFHVRFIVLWFIVSMALECNMRGSTQGKRVHMRAKRALGGKDMVQGFSKVAGGLPRVPTSLYILILNWFRGVRSFSRTATLFALFRAKKRTRHTPASEPGRLLHAGWGRTLAFIHTLARHTRTARNAVPRVHQTVVLPPLPRVHACNGC